MRHLPQIHDRSTFGGLTANPLSIVVLLSSTLLLNNVVFAAEAPPSPTPEKTDAEPVKETTIEREQEADEDPLVAQTSELHEKTGYWYREHTSLKAYGSARYRYSISDYESGFSDGGTRAGLSGELQWKPRFWLLGRAELGFNLFDNLKYLLNASGRSEDEDQHLSARLVYAGISTPSTTLTVGKNWSAYYQVSGLTDRFEDFGGEASGTFNAQTDGGATGTGRASGVIQGRFSVDKTPDWWNLKPFNLNFQYQAGQSIPHAEDYKYQHSLGISARLETKREGFLGIAYNHAVIQDEDLPVLRATGIDGDAQALVIGTRRFGDDYYISTTVSWLKNHEATDENIYFDGWGWEAFLSRRVAPRWWVIGGWNALTPQDNQPETGDYRLRYGVVGLRYTFDGFKQMVYSEIRLDDSRLADGTKPGNIYSIGVRWDIP